MPDEGERARPAGRTDRERLLATAIRHARESIVITDGELDPPGPRILYANFGFETMTGYAPEEVLGKSPRILQGPATDRRVLDRLRRQLSRGEDFFGQAINYRKDGTPFWLEWHISPVRDDAGRITRFVALQRDVTERKRAETALRDRERALRLITDSLPAQIAEIDRDHRFRFVNRALCSQLERKPEDILGHPVPEILGERMHAALRPHQERAFGGEGVSFEHEATNLDGSTQMGLHQYVPAIDERGRVAAVYCLTMDVTELKRAERERLEFDRQHQQAQRLESLGLFASGIAHDFNNILTAILGNASVTLQELDPDSAAGEGVREIEAAAQRGAELVRGMLDYAGRTALRVRPTDLPDLVRDMSGLLQACCSARAELRYELYAAPPVGADPTGLRQILMNLVTNASQSLADEAGTVRIRTGEAVLDRKALDALTLGTGRRAGRYGFLEVADDGPGVPEHLRSRIFDPYVSSKQSGRGLGLAIVLGLVRSQGGAIELESTQGAGTRFRVLFPAASEAADAVPAAPRVTASRPKLPAGTVLFVDDEAGIRRYAVRALRNLGLGALTAGDADEAVELLRRSEDGVLAVVLDLTMPGRATEKAIAALRELRPEAPILITSGASPRRVESLLALDGVSGFLQKPFSLQQLAEQLLAALET